MKFAFDRDIGKIGKYVEDVLIHDIQDLDQVVALTGARTGIVSVSAPSAQRVVDKLVSAGIEAILNFAPRRVEVPEGIRLQRVDLSIELDKLFYRLGKSGEPPNALVVSAFTNMASVSHDYGDTREY